MKVASQRDVGCLFDVDGTLVDSNWLHTLAWARALRDADEDAPMAEIHRLVGLGSDRFVTELLGRDVPAARERHGARFAELHADLRPLPGAAELLRTVAGLGMRVVLATSSGEEDLKVLRQVIDADDAIDDATSKSDVETSKPAPDIFEAALDAAGLTPERALVVGDTIWDVEAASRCGLRTIALLSGGWSRAELEDAGAVAVYRDAADLRAQLSTSPIGRLAELLPGT